MPRSISSAVHAAPGKEHLVSEWWKSLGYQVHMFKAAKVKRGPIWVTLASDLWECIDVAAMLPDAVDPFVYTQEFFAFEYAQVCTPDGARQHKRKVEAQKWPLRQLNLSYRVTLWIYRGSDFRVLEWHGGRDWREWPEHVTLRR